MAQLKMKKQEPLEGQIQNAVCEYLTRKRHFFWRSNNVGVQRVGKNGKTFWTNNKYAMKGVPDIIVLTNGGYAVFLEIKRPSEKLKPDQIIFKNRCEAIGCEYYRITSVEQLPVLGL